MRSTRLGRRERGAILIVTLLFLVILTMLGVTAMTGTTMEERMAGNTRDHALAFQAAEAALRDARRDISGFPVNPATAALARPTGISPAMFDTGAPGTCSTRAGEPGLCSPGLDAANQPYNRLFGTVLPNTPNHNMLAAPSVGYGQTTGAQALGGPGMLARQPRYVIENFCLNYPGESLQPLCKFYRITARGYGRSPNSQVTLQEVFISL